MSRMICLRGVAAIALAAPAAMLTGRAVRADEPKARPNIQWDVDNGRAVLTNGRLELIVETRPGLNAHSLRDWTSGAVHADRHYSWPGGAFPTLSGLGAP